MNDREFQFLLETPLPSLADDGFSARVIARLLDLRLRNAHIETVLWGATALAAIGSIAATGAGGAIDRLLPQIATSPAFAAASVTVILSLMLARYVAE
jgi:hypothetical protein